jgi:hypothetical protein
MFKDMVCIAVWPRVCYVTVDIIQIPKRICIALIFRRSRLLMHYIFA